jgi:membrane associated rhomboid family serine protease
VLLPLGDRPRLSDRRPWATWGLAAVMLALHALPGEAAAVRLLEHAAHPAAGASPRTLVLHTLVHGGAWHLLGNLVFLLVFAPNVERRVGPAGLLALFLLCGAAGGLAFAATTGEGALIGASGAVLGITAFHAVLLPGQRVLLLVWLLVVWVGELPSRLVALGLVALDVLALLVTGFGGGRVALAAHLGGALLGAALGLAAAYASSRAKAATRAMPDSISASEQA